MVNALDKRTSGAKAGGLARSISELRKAGKAVPQSKLDSLDKVNKEMARIDKELKAEKAKAGKQRKNEPEADLFKAVEHSDSIKDEGLVGMSALLNKGRKRKKIMLDDELDFEATDQVKPKAPSASTTQLHRNIDIAKEELKELKLESSFDTSYWTARRDIAEKEIQATLATYLPSITITHSWLTADFR